MPRSSATMTSVALIVLVVGVLIGSARAAADYSQCRCPCRSQCNGWNELLRSWGSCGSGGCSDPVFYGQDGRTFYFDGEPDKFFNILTEEDHQLNALFVGTEHTSQLASVADTNGTYMGELGLKMYGTTVKASVNNEGNATVEVNGVIVELEEADGFTKTFKFDHDVTVTVQKYEDGFGETVRASSPLFQLMFAAVPYGWDPIFNQTARGHLDMSLGVDADLMSMTEVHGVLGQTSHARSADTALLPDELNAQFIGDGKQSDYVVSNLWADDFKFNLYGTGKTNVPKMVHSGFGEKPTFKKGSTLKMSASKRRFLREGALAGFNYSPLLKITGSQGSFM